MAAGLAMGAAAAQAYQCEAGGQPGSTLLFPYFEVDPTRPDGLTTLISINNDSPSATLVRVRLWDEWSRVSLGFNLLLKAHGVQTINLRDLLIEGNVPPTGGPELIGFDGCLTYPPSTHNPVYSPNVWKGFAGDVSCLSNSPIAHDNARGFITVDTIRRCDNPTGFPYAPYFDHPVYGVGTTTIKNVLWGDLLFVNPLENSAQGVEAVAIRGDEVYPAAARSFYSAGDKRAPLPRTWTLRYLNGGAFDGGTDLIVFHGIREFGLACTTPPAWFPLTTPQLTVLDEAGVKVLGPGPSDSFPLATQKVKVSDLRLRQGGGGPQADFGVMELEFGHDSWVIPLMSASGRFSVGMNAIPKDNPCP
jgi:hypothetical protein